MRRHKKKFNNSLLSKILILFFFLSSSTVQGAIHSFEKDINKKRSNVAQKTIEGYVYDETNTPLSGVTITEKETLNKSTTDENGHFTINVSSENSILSFSYVGFKTTELKADIVSKVTMYEDTDLLEEVVVVGFGTQKKKDLTGAVDQVGAEDINNKPVANLGQALQGLVPNLNVGFGNGNPKTEASFNVRGTTSLYYDSNDGNYKSQTGSPLILIDGVPGDINRINPEDVESVSVLKDAASAAIYGARAAFGVMLVTTKSGKSGRSQVDFSSSFQWNKPAAVPNILDAATLQEAVILGYENRGLTAPSNEVEKLEKIKAYMADPVNNLPYYETGNNNVVWVANTNPYEEALAKSAPMQKYNLSFSGGNDKTTYYGSAGYQNQDGIYKINTDNMKRYNANLNLSSKINDWFRMDFRSNYNNSTYEEPHSPAGKGGWWTAMSQEPGRNVNMPIKTPTSSPVGEVYTDNILSFMDYGANDWERKGNLVLTASPKITPLPGWNIQADISYKNYNRNLKEIVPLHERLESNWNTTTVHTNPSYIYRNRIENNQYTINVFTDYSKTFNDKHNVTGLIGFNQEWFNENSVSARRNDINPSIPVLGQAAGVQTVGDSEQHWAVRGLFYRLTYDYEGKYLLQSNGRYDGTSRFGKNTRFAFFPSFSAGWVVTQESFADAITPYVNFLKLRGSYGSLGNQNVSNYAYLLYYNTTSDLSYLFDGDRPVYITPPGLNDANLTWETSATIDFGFDMNILSHWEVNFDWYKRTTSDILVEGFQYPITLGTASPQTNAGEIQTKGWELSTSYKNNTPYDLGYKFRLTLSDYTSKITKYNGNQEKLISYLYEGQQIGDIWGYETVGIFQNQEQIDNSPSQNKISSGIWYPGDIQYADINGDSEISSGKNTVEDPGDKKIIGNSTPRFQFGFTTDLNYKNFDFSIFLQGVGKRDLWVGNSLFWGAGAIGTHEVYHDSWTPDRPNAHYPLYYSDGKNRQVQTRYLQNGAYLRVKTVSLGYNLPAEIAQNIKFSNIRLYGSAYNLFEFKSLPKTFDPELTGMNYPIMRSFAFGVQASF